jgi:hypothetical protein
LDGTEDGASDEPIDGIFDGTADGFSDEILDGT